MINITILCLLMLITVLEIITINKCKREIALFKEEVKIKDAEILILKNDLDTCMEIISKEILLKIKKL